MQHIHAPLWFGSSVSSLEAEFAWFVTGGTVTVGEK